MMNFNFRSSDSASPAQVPVQSAASQYSLADRVQGWLKMRSPREQRLRLVETLPLGPRRSVAMIECDGQHFLAGLGADGVTTLVPVNGSHVRFDRDGAA